MSWFWYENTGVEVCLKASDKKKNEKNIYFFTFPSVFHEMVIFIPQKLWYQKRQKRGRIIVTDYLILIISLSKMAYK